MYQFMLFIHVFVAILIVGLVLLQQGKGAAAGAAFGSGASQTMFGSRGSGSFLFRLTMTLIAVFFITSIAMNNMAMQAYKQERVITLPETPVRQAPVNSMPANSEKAANAAAPSVPASQDGEEIPVRQ